MHIIKPWLDAVFHARVFTTETADAIAGLLEGIPVSAFPLDMRCQMLGILKSCILANEQGLSGLASYATTIPDVEKRYGRTLTHIFNLQSHSRFSPTIEQKLTNRVTTVAERLRNNEDLKNWANLSVYDRLGLLDEIKKFYVTVHGLKPIKICMKEFNPTEKHGEASNGLRKPQHTPDITIGRHVIEQSTPDLALEVLYHECTHVYFGQLARAHRRIKPENPVAVDAKLAYYRATYESYCPSAIRPAYDNDGEEMIATTKGREFAAKMRENLAYKNG